MFKFNKKIIIISIGFLVVGFLIWSISNLSEVEEIQAGEEDNVFGWAWSENIGWISFNSTNCDSNEDGFSDGMPSNCPPAGTPMTNYGVNINEITGVFSGYAWSENIGWISFNQPQLSGCPSGTCQAEVNLSNYEVSGWARALANDGGWDGWIKLDGVNINSTTQQFEGWAWGDDVVGWVSFNCNNPETPTACSDSDYKVITSFVFSQPPQVEFPEIEYEQYCGIFTGQGLVGFKWIYRDEDGGNESRFDFRVNDINNVNDSNPEVDRTFEGLSRPSGTANTQSILVKSSLEADKITFDETYYWWARVWDDEGNNSGWVAGPSITTDSHAWPDPDFIWFPSPPSVDEAVQFCATQEAGICAEDVSTCYDINNNPISCFVETFLWTLPLGVEFIEGSLANTKNPQMKFSSSDSYNIKLEITDNVGTCPKTQQVGVTFPLPEWEESAP